MKLAYLAPLLLAGCAELSTRASAVCGNRVLDPTEDCDSATADCTAACRFTCEVTPCPDGWVCGDDELCRHATGAFRETGDPVPGTSFELRLEDLDADGRTDAFGYTRSQLFVHPGLLGGRLGPRATIPIAGFHGVAFGDLDEDGITDAVVGDEESCAVVHGGVPLAFVAQPSSTSSAPFVLERAVRIDPRDRLLLTISQETGGAITAAFTGGLAVELAPSTPNTYDIAARIAVLDLDGDDRDELLMLSPTFDTAQQFSVVDLAGVSTLVPGPTLALGGNDFVIGVFAADVTGDGIRDVVTAREVALDTFAAIVAPGDGLGGFGAPAAQPDLAPPGGVLALADLDGDDVVEVIAGSGVWTRGGPQRAAATSPWFSAATGDFNHDGLRDVAAISQLGVEVLLSDGAGRFGHSIHVRDRGLREFPFIAGGVSVGDFDGDLFDDIVVNAYAPGDDAGEPLVLFGGAAGIGDDVTSLGVFERTGSIALLDVIRSATGLRDAAIDIVVGARRDSYELTVFYGNADRIARASFELSRRLEQPLIGRFDGDALEDVLAIYFDEATPEAELVVGRGDGRLRATDRTPVTLSGAPLEHWCATSSISILVPGSSNFAGALVADLDGDGRDEIIGVPCADGAIQIARFGGTRAAPTLEVTNVLPMAALAPLAGTFRGKSLLADLDRDGALDLVVTFTNPFTVPGLAIVWGATGTLSTTPTIITAAQLGIANLSSLAAIQADADPDVELIVGSVGADTRVPRIDIHADRSIQIGETFAFAASVTGGDLDGDGLDDLVVARGGRLQVYLGCANDDPSCP